FPNRDTGTWGEIHDNSESLKAAEGVLYLIRSPMASGQRCEENYGSGKCEPVSACEGEWDTVWVSGAAASAALFFSCALPGAAGADYGEPVWAGSVCGAAARRCEFCADGADAGDATAGHRSDGAQDGGADALRFANCQLQPAKY